MNAVDNPFSPGAGARPPELAGRGSILEQGRVLFARTRQKRSEKSMLLTGLRGVGKTVLLNELAQEARKQEYLTLLVEAQDDKSLPALIIPPLLNLLYEMDRLSGAKQKVKRALVAVAGIFRKMKARMGEIEISLDIEPEAGVADSGDLSADLPELFIRIGEAAQDRNRGVALLIDEIQYFSEAELGALIMAMHQMQQRQLPVVLLGAGLPILPELAGNSKSYAERLFSFPRIGALTEEDSAKALCDPVEEVGVRFEPDALSEVFRMTKGYPYFVQEWGYQVWNLAPGSPITRSVVVEATARVVSRLDENFFRVRYDRLTPGEQKVLRAMAELGVGPCRIGDVARLLGKKKAEALSPMRKKLIRKGMIYPSAHGEIAFTVPLFDEFMRRAIPDFAP